MTIDKLVARLDHLLVTKPCSSDGPAIRKWNNRVNAVADKSFVLFKKTGGSKEAEALSNRAEAFIDR